MTRFGPRIEPITSQTPSGCATKYATDAGQKKTVIKVLKIELRIDKLKITDLFTVFFLLIHNMLRKQPKL